MYTYTFYRSHNQYNVRTPSRTSRVTRSDFLTKLFYHTFFSEQLQILRDRIEKKKNKERIDFAKPEMNPLEEWTQDVKAKDKQPSEPSESVVECTCKGPNPTPADSNGQILDSEQKDWAFLFFLLLFNIEVLPIANL